MFTTAWMFHVDEEHRDRFIKAYGPDGAWASLFGRGDGYVDTILLQDVAHAERFVTLDRWATRAAHDAFRRSFHIAANHGSHSERLGAKRDNSCPRRNRDCHGRADYERFKHRPISCCPASGLHDLAQTNGSAVINEFAPRL